MVGLPMIGSPTSNGYEGPEAVPASRAFFTFPCPMTVAGNGFLQGLPMRFLRIPAKALVERFPVFS